MEQLHPKPVPLPRSQSPAGHNPIYENHQLKKPTPLPRSTRATAASASIPEEEKVFNESSSFEEAFTKGYNTLTKSLKNKFKSASENVQGKGKLVLETTKTVGLRTERSVRGIIQKRQSAVPHLESKTDPISFDQNTLKSDRCQSLPSDDIFSSITFNSPITHSDKVTDTDDDTDSLPPPEYPPPPLPDESLYDELSVRSSHSGSQGEYYTCPSIMSSLPDFDSSRIDENISDLKKLSMFVGGSSNSSLSDEIMFRTNSCNKPRNTNIKTSSGYDLSNGGQGTNPTAQVSRSESWGFYDTVFLPKAPKQEENVNVDIQRENISTHKDILSKDEQNKQYVNVSIGNKKQTTMGTNDPYVNVSIIDKDASSQSQVLITNQKPTVVKPLCPLKRDVNDRTSNRESQTRRQDSVSSTTDSDCSSMSVPNELYMNWQPQMFKKYQDRTINENLSITNRLKNNLFISKPFFSEFDPLCNSEGSDRRARDRHSITESLPVFNNEEKLSGDNDEFDTVSLPVPPKRFDSITTETKEKPDIPNDVEYFLYQRPITSFENKTIKGKPKTQGMEDHTSTPQNPNSDSHERELPSGKRKSQLVRWSSMKRAMKKLADGSSWSPGVMRKSLWTKDEDESGSSSEAVERPIINSNSAPLHSGAIYKSSSAGEKQRDFAKRHCQLAEGRLIFTSENSSNKDVISLIHIYSIQIVRETKQSNDGEDMYCFEINNSQRDKPRHLLGCVCTTDRRIWMQRILESMTQVFPSKLSADYTRAGWCFIKEGISGSWVAAWIILHKRRLFFHPSQGTITTIDLRKARLIVLQEREEGCVRVAENGPVLRIDGPACAFYLQMNETRETKAWHRTIREAAVNNGPELQDQQLTKDDLPVIIEKCINFIYTHGSMSEGIYRRSGSNTSVLKLHTAFQKDAWAVQITKNDYSEHEVASVLKRFFRDLPEPLITKELHLVLRNAAGLGCSEKEKVALYRSQLEKLPPVNYVTTRRLMGHLHHISQQCERNLMPVDNLAAIWGPTLMQVGIDPLQTEMDPNWSRSETQVVAELILLYPQLFYVGGAELAREQRIQEVLERYHNSVQLTPHTTKPSGDIKVWVYIGAKDSDPVNVTVSPQREALDVCNELSPHMKVYGHELCLLESVLSGALIRPLHHTERVLDTVLRWGYWDDNDCRDNCLILVINTILQDIAPLAKPPVAQCGELRFADLKSKNFKPYLFEFSQAKLCYYKDKTCSVKLGEWKVEDIVWYIGHEPKRNPHTRWSLTFINKNGRNKRSKENPFFGFTVAGTTRDEQLRWMAAMLVGEYPHVDLLPKSLLNLLE